MRQGTKRYRCWAVSVALLVGVSGRGTLSWGQMPGELTQLLGFDGCIAEVGGATCTDGRALGDPLGSGAVTISPDGKHVYVASLIGDAVAVFTRNKTTGALTQLPGTDGCISETGSGGVCTDGKALSDVVSVVVSKDGKHVYVASTGSDAVAAFAREK